MLRDVALPITFSLNHLGPMPSFTCEQKEFLSAAVEITVNLDFWCSYKSKNDGGSYSLGCHSETHANLVMKLFEAASWFCLTREEAILTPDCCSEWLHSRLVACDLYSLCRMISLQLSIGEWFRGHGETILVFFRNWSRYFSFLSFHVFFDKLSNKLLWLFYLFVFFHMKLHFRVFLRIKTIQVSSGAILSFAKKVSGLN